MYERNQQIIQTIQVFVTWAIGNGKNGKMVKLGHALTMRNILIVETT